VWLQAAMLPVRRRAAILHNVLYKTASARGQALRGWLITAHYVK